MHATQVIGKCVLSIDICGNNLYIFITGDPAKWYTVGIMKYTVDRVRHDADRVPVLAHNIHVRGWQHGCMVGNIVMAGGPTILS